MPEKSSSQGLGIRRELVAFKRMPFQVDVFGGICAAIAYRLAVPTWVVRLLTAVLVFWYGIGFGLYMLLWIFVPRAKALPADYEERTGHSTD